MFVQAVLRQVILPFTMAWVLLVNLATGSGAAEPELKPLSPQPSAGQIAPSQNTTPIRMPADAAGWHKRGHECLERGDWEDAVASFDQAIAKSSKNAASYYYRAVAKEHIKPLQESLDDYGQAIRLRPSWGSACLRRGNLLVRMGEFKQGLAEQKKAFRLGKFDERGLEFVYVDPSSSVQFRFVYVPPGEGVIGYDEDARVKIVKESLQPFFGHNATPAQRVHIQQGFFLLDREITVAQYRALIPRSDKPPPKPGPGRPVETPTAPATKAEKTIGQLWGKDRKSPVVRPPTSGEGLDLRGDTPEKATPPATNTTDAGKTEVSKLPDQAASVDRPVETSAPPAAKTEKTIGTPREKDRKSPAVHPSMPEEGLDLRSDTSDKPAAPAAGKTHAGKKEVPKPQDQPALSPDQPISDISWHEANSFCWRFQARLGLVVRLPSEIEWEYAARGDNARLYPWEDEGFHAWAEHPDSSPRPSPPENRDVSWVGAYDMAGNVSEWCLDTYKESLFGKSSAVVLYNPLSRIPPIVDSKEPKPMPDWRPNKEIIARAISSGSGRGESRSANATEQNSLAVTYRGGSYRDSRLNCQSPVRRSANAIQQDQAIGFRPVLLLKTAQ